MNRRPHASRPALVGLAVGLGMALAANLAYAIPRGPVAIGLGIAAPLVLPLTLYLRSTFAVAGFWPRVCREAAMVAVAAPAVTISFSHTFHLVLGAGEPWLVAVLAPLSSDGVAGMATLALHGANRPRKAPRPAATPQKPQNPQNPAEPDELARKRERDAARKRAKRAEQKQASGAVGEG